MAPSPSDASSEIPPELHERLLDAVGDAVFATWPDGTIFLWNRRATELFGWAKQEATGKNLLSLTPGPQLADEAQEMLSSLQAGERWEGDVRFRRVDGSNFPGRVSAAPVLDEGGKLEAISFLAHDRTTELRQQEKIAEHARELEHRNEQLRSLAVAAVHNFSEPVRDVVAHTQRIERMLEGLTEPELEEAFKIVREGAMRMRDLAQGLNRYAELAGHEVHVEAVALGEVVDGVLDGLEERVSQTDASVHVAELPTVLADPEDLEVAFKALVENALDFQGEAPPEIEITARQREDMHVIAVKDNGIGIASHLHERIFRPFQRVHSYDERPGIGLGLTIARELVEGCGGSIWVDSTPEEGATFYVTLPATMGLEPEQRTAELAQPAPLLSEPGADLFEDA